MHFGCISETGLNNIAERHTKHWMIASVNLLTIYLNLLKIIGGAVVHGSTKYKKVYFKEFNRI